jgi:hypothetical protein
MTQPALLQQSRAFSLRSSISRAAAWIGRASAVVPPRSVGERSTPAEGLSTFEEPEEVSPVMERKEVVRARTFGAAVALLCLVSVFVQHINDVARPRPLRGVATVALAVLGATALYVWYRSRDPDRCAYSPLLLRVFGIVGVVTSFIFELHMGILSPITGVVVLGLSFFGMSRNRRSVTGLGSLVVGSYLTAGLLVAMGFIPDVGLFQMRQFAPATRVGMVLLFAGV